ncbi:MAG TPA: S8 family serine peptidase [Pyrinomonadaceae bacterium]|nr:S8 family serine peptidase [Pyrinomonadaceae bacterium]
MSRFLNGRRIFAAIVISISGLLVYEKAFTVRPEAFGPRMTRNSTPDAKFSGSDKVTEAIRDGSFALTRIYTPDKTSKENAANVGTIVEDYGRFVVVARHRSFSAKNLGLDEDEITTTVHLPGAVFEPLKSPPPGSLRLGRAATSNGKGYYIVQFGGTVTDEWMKSVSDLGVEILQYVPHQAFFVYGESEAIARLADHSRVRWIGSYGADQKLSSVVKDQLAAARGGKALARGISPIETTKKASAVFDIAVFSRADLSNFIKELVGQHSAAVIQTTPIQNNFFNLVRVEAALDKIEAIAAMPDVFTVEAFVRTRNEDERAGQILGGNYIDATTILGPSFDPQAQFGADGTNITVSVVDDGVGIPGDGGFYISSLNAVNGPLRGTTSGALGHGHFNATLIAGSTPFGALDNLFYNYGKGIAPRAHIVNLPRNKNGYTGTDPEVYNDSVSTPGPNGAHAMISNNSWGNGTNSNSYSTMESMFDGIVLDASTVHPAADAITMIFSAGNEAFNGLTRPKTAKNLIAVGSTENLRSELAGTNGNNMDDLAADSSRGPAADGRIKPDIVAPGSAVTGGRSGSNTLSGNIDAAHRWSSGTSHAAANITGVAALFANYYRNNNFGQRPMPSLIKAALINSAVDTNGENTGAPIPNANEGWGRPNLKFMMNTGVGMKYINQEVALDSPGQGFELNGSVASSTKPVRITLVWSDPPAAGSPALVNDLDLTVNVGGTLYRGNVFSNGVSVPGGTADSVNNVENVFLPAGIPVGTSLNVVVTAKTLNGDGVLYNGDATDQNYSVVVYNWSPSAGQSFHTISGQVISQSGRGVFNARVRLTDSQGGVREGLTNHLGYFTFTSVAGGQNYTVNITAKRYTFAQQNVSVNGNLTNLSFQATNNGP